MSTSSHLRRSATVLASSLLTAALVVSGSSGAATGAPRDRTLPATGHGHGAGVYVVTLVHPPAAAYTGGVPGLAATRPRGGERFDRTRPDVAAYRARLVDRQDRVLRQVGSPPVLYRFTTAVNGFAARLGAGQVKRLRSTPGVSLVERSTLQKLDTVDSAGFLGLDQVWSQVGGRERAGEGTVVGVVDSGIWPENPSFAGLPQSSPGRVGRLDGFHGACAGGRQWNVGDCNTKLVSARWFVRGFGPSNLAQSEFLSPRDSSGHGSHVAATAAGNADVGVRVEGQDFGKATGMAPGAAIAVYKACWTAPNPEDDGCSTADTVAAVDQAVADGVDVINYSVSGSRDTVADSVELAFLNATAAGVFVAASAGNSGPAPGTVGHPGPWVTTVGASTHRLLQGSVVLGDGTEQVGAMVADRPVPRTGIVLAEDAAAPGATATAARLCEVGALDSDEVQDKIVVCDRGVVARVDKSTAVSRAGGVGMVLTNVSPDTVDADFHAVPTVHLDAAAGAALKQYLASAEAPTAAIDPDGADDTPVPQVAAFSARGPSPASGGDVLKPDLTAPGVGVLAAVAPPSNAGRLWDLYSGTSVSTPHVAGLAALARTARPTWSPARIRSAMMTTARGVRGTSGAFAEGAGQVDPTRFLDPGLVLDVAPRDYLGFLAGQGFTHADGTPVSDRPVAASSLNLPSIAVGHLTGRTTLTRTVTNVSGSTETYSARVRGLDGVTARVRPGTVTLAPGASATLEVVVRADTDAAVGRFTKGHLLLRGSQHELRLPVAVRPGLVSATGEVRGTGEDGSVPVAGRSGSDQGFPLSVAGPVAARPTGVSLVPGGFEPASPRADRDTRGLPVTVPPGTDVARFQIDGHRPSDDMDLYAYRYGQLVAASTRPSADETITLVEPEPGDYTVYVHSHSAANRSTTTGQYYSWVVPASDGGTLQLEPAQVTAGANQRFEYTVGWQGLDPTSRWFGAVRYGDSEHRTFVSVN